MISVHPGPLDLNYRPETPSLAAFTQTELGVAGTFLDGYEAAHAAAVMQAGLDALWLTSLYNDIDGIVNATNSLVAFEVDTDLAAFGDAAAAGDPLIGEVGTDLTPPASSSPSF